MRSAEENNLEKDLRKWFNKLQRKIQKLIDTYYEDELFFLHVNKVYTIVEEMKPEYRAILLKHGLTQFYNARETTTTLYTIQQKKVSVKAGLYEPQIIREEDVGLFRTNPQIEDSLRYNTFQASDKTLNRVTENITNNLDDSYHEGLGIKDAGRRINKEFAGLKGWESRRIARTEINSAQNEGAFSAYDELGVEYQMWWTGQDDRVRDSHRPLHGHIVAVGNTFSNGLLYPGDKSGPIKEWINCRCTSVPYIIPLGKMAPPGLTEFTEEQLIDIPGYTPITIEDALNGEYPLEYYTEGGVVNQYKNNKLVDVTFRESSYESGSLDKVVNNPKDLKRLINDKNVRVDVIPKKRDWSKINTSGLEDFSTDEQYIKCYFKKEKLTIYKSVNATSDDVYELLKEYKSLKPILQNSDSIILSKQLPMTSKEFPIPGFSIGKDKSIVVFRPTKENPLRDTLIHESTHLLESSHGYFISNSEEYVRAFEKTKKRINDISKEYSSDYALRFSEKALRTNHYGDKFVGHRIYSEDLAESMVAYLKNKKAFTDDFPEKAKVLEKVLSGKFDKKSTITYKKVVDDETKKFVFTPEEEMKWLKLQQKISSGRISTNDLEDYHFLKDKAEFSELYAKRVKNKKYDKKRYKELYDKLEERIDMNYMAFSEGKPSKRNLNKGKLKFNPEEIDDWDDLHSRRGKLEFPERKRLQRYEEQLEFNKFYEKYGNELPKDYDEAKRYRTLLSRDHIAKKLGQSSDDFFETEKINTLKTNNYIKDTEYTGDIKNPKNIKEFKGTTKDGMLPEHESISRYFTKDVSTTGKYDEIIYKWVYEGWYHDAQFYHNELKWDEKELRKWVKEECKDLSVAQQEEKIQEILIEWKQFKDLMKDAKLKKNMKLHRTQRKLHEWPNPKVGDKVTINANRSFSISREGVEEYRKGGKKGWWNIELVAPAGMDGVYISPKAISEEHNNKYIRQMEVIGGPDIQAEITYIGPDPDESGKNLIRLEAII